MRLRLVAVLTVVAAGPAVRPAQAAFHLMNVVEVFPGTAAAPGAQYVVLQMWADGQNLVKDHTITFYDRLGGDPVTFTFGGNVPNGASQDKIFIANAAAQGFFNLTPDLLITGTPIRPEGGKICFEVWDCVAWGNYAGDPTGVGTPFARPVGLAPGRAMRRRLDIAGGPTTLEQADDTHDSANDFLYGFPAPRNNANQDATVLTSICQNNVLESFEECDDGNAVPDDACTNTCTVTRVFADGLESADTSRWHASATGTGELTVTPEAALAGSYGLQGAVNDTQGLFVQNDSPMDESRFRARFRFDPNGFDPGEALNHFRTRIFIAFEEAPTRRLLAVVLRRIGGQYALMARARRDDNSQANTGFFEVTDGPHWVELDWQRSTTSGPGNGSLRFWIDGALVSTLTSLENGVSAVDFVRLGALSLKDGAAGTMFWDDFDARRETSIGPFVP